VKSAWGGVKSAWGGVIKRIKQVESFYRGLLASTASAERSAGRWKKSKNDAKSKHRFFPYFRASAVKIRGRKRSSSQNLTFFSPLFFLFDFFDFVVQKKQGYHPPNKLTAITALKAK
jgi:hypothetical protein